ncbi:MAG: MMPL family transporter [Nitrospirae bacterium]|nr:MMPL family transporter [Nitrospirota bacterium]
MTVYIYNEYYFRYHEIKDRKTAIIETMKVVGNPLIYTDITTAVGFASLLIANIIPIKVFGLGIAFGTASLLLLSFTLIPALMTFVRVEKIARASDREDDNINRVSVFLRKLGGIGAYRPKATALLGCAILIISLIGIKHLVINNNLVDWFKYGSKIRTADRVLNSSLGGTSLGYIAAIAQEEEFIKTPEAMKYIEGLQRYLEKLPVVGKTFSVVDYVKRINRVLHSDNPIFDSVPETKEAIGQYLFLFGMSAKPSDLDNVIDSSSKMANIWIQLKTWDARAMRDVLNAVAEYKKKSTFPLELQPAGIAYFNLVWNNEVLWDMIKGFIFALVAVFIILIFNFRSVKWAIISYIPLLFTMLIIYGAVGFIGKDFDMPTSALSCLSLGMAVDFGIHFVARFRRRLSEKLESDGYKENPDSGLITDALLWTAARPGKGILRNAILFSAAFSVMLFAPLIPYVTVGAFIMGMMMLSAILSIIYLPALITLMKGWLFKQEIV